MASITLHPIATSALGLSVLATLLAILAVWRQAALLKRYRQLLRTPAGTDVDQLLLDHGAEIHDLRSRLAVVGSRLGQVEAAAVGHVQKVGMVRFSAFPGVGGDLSYAVALLDGAHNGVVFSSLYGRSECRAYAKPILDGTSTYTLTDEEKAALAKALSGPAP